MEKAKFYFNLFGHMLLLIQLIIEDCLNIFVIKVITHQISHFLNYLNLSLKKLNKQLNLITKLISLYLHLFNNYKILMFKKSLTNKSIVID